jgi:hypothetical protein
MYDKQAQSDNCLIHYDDFFIQFRRDFLRICDYTKYDIEYEKDENCDTECMAKILRYLEYETNALKRAHRTNALNSNKEIPTPKKWPVKAGLKAIIEFAFLGKTSEPTIRKAIAMLEKMKFVEVKNIAGKTPIYYLELENVQESLNKDYQLRYQSANDPQNTLPPKKLGGEKSLPVTPKKIGGSQAQDPQRFLPQYNKENNTRNDRSSSSLTSSPKETEPKPYLIMLEELTDTQQAIHKLNLLSEPQVVMQMDRYREEEVKKYKAALNFFSSIEVTLEQLNEARKAIASPELKMQHFISGGTAHLWDLFEHWKKYLAWKNEIDRQNRPAQSAEKKERAPQQLTALEKKNREMMARYGQPRKAIGE